MTTPNQSISVDETMALMVEWHQQVSEDHTKESKNKETNEHANNSSIAIMLSYSIINHLLTLFTSDIMCWFYFIHPVRHSEFYLKDQVLLLL